MKVSKMSRICPICNSEKFSKLRNAIDARNPFWRRCKSCFSVYARDIPEKEILEEYYNVYYGEDNLNIPNFVAIKLGKQIKNFEQFRSNINSILDIGYGAGIFLHEAQKKGWKCSGSEYSPESIRIGVNSGWNVHLGDLDEKVLLGPYDVVTAIEVLEHVSRPETIVQEAKSRLRVGGAFYGTTPNANSINLKMLGEKWSVLSYPEHQVLLSKKSIRYLMKQNGMKILDLKTTGLNPIDLLNLAKRKIRRTPEPDNKPFDRVNGGYAVNNFFEDKKILRFLKGLINQILSILNIGDSLTFLTIKNKS